VKEKAGKRLVILPIAVALMAIGALGAYVSTWWTVAQPGEEVRLLATIFVLGTVALICVAYWLSLRSQAQSDERYHELKALAEKVANAVTRSTTDNATPMHDDAGYAKLADEVAEIREAVAKIAAKEGEAYLRGFMVGAADADGENRPPLVA
jgi:uncharacterized membrane protein YciS (DUF1049 family)